MEKIKNCNPGNTKQTSVEKIKHCTIGKNKNSQLNIIIGGILTTMRYRRNSKKTFNVKYNSNHILFTFDRQNRSCVLNYHGFILNWYCVYVKKPML